VSTTMASIVFASSAAIASAIVEKTSGERVG